MHRRARPRPVWDQLPPELRRAVEQLLGSTVQHAESQEGGWSPGSADRLLLADGRRVFVKTASAEVNARTVSMHREEAEVLAVLRGSAVAPGVIGTVAAGPCFGLIVEDVEGRHPDPRSAQDVAAVLDAVADLPEADEAARALLPLVVDELANDALGWRRLLDDQALDGIPEPARRALPALDALARRYRTALSGDSVVHLDLRFDNALIDARGRGRLVDWPSAAVGAGWIDGVTLLLDLRRLAGTRAAARHEAHPLFVAARDADVDVLLSVLGAYFLDAARKPPSPGMAGVRAFQRTQGLLALEWLLDRRPDLLA